MNVVLNLESDICLKVGILLWKMWDARNKVNAGEKALSSQEVCGATICMPMEIQEGAEMKIQQPHSGVCNHRWEPPGEDCLKINVDGGFQT